MRKLTTGAALLAALLAASLAPPAAADPATAPWPDDAVSRLAALALIETLDADLLSHDSATLTLDRWCDAHRLASPAKVVAERRHGEEEPPSDESRRRLGVGADEPVRYRHVRLSCGTHVLSEADNWYVPARLTPEMNRILDTSDTAFGRAVAALRFTRRTISSERLWDPLPAGWEMGASLPGARVGDLAIPHEVLRHRAVLSLPDGTPFSEVVETYTGDVLAFPRPPVP